MSGHSSKGKEEIWVLWMGPQEENIYREEDNQERQPEPLERTYEDNVGLRKKEDILQR